MNTMAVSVVLSVTHKGLKSMPPRNSASAARPVAAPTTSTLSAGAIVAKSAWVGRTWAGLAASVTSEPSAPMTHA